jgi:C4-dicarboxylate-binding protein DctP
MMIRGTHVMVGLIAAASVAIGSTAMSKTFKLTAIDGYPARAMWVKEFSKFFIPEVNRRLAKMGKHNIKWSEAYGGTIVKLGLGDIGVVTTVFHGDKVPLQAIAYVTPFVSTNPKVVARSIDALAAKYPQFKAAFAKQNQVYLATGVVLDSYQVFSKKPIKSLADMKGVKMAGAGFNLRYLDGIGAVGVGGSLVTYYNKLQTGVVTAAMIWPEAATTFKLYEVAPYMLRADIGAAASKVVTANAKSWKKLPADVRAAIQGAAIAYRDHIADVALKRAGKSVAKLKAKGMKMTTLSPAARLAWAKSMPNIAKSWAANLEKKGIPGKAILSDYMNMMRAAGQKPVRDWDKE